MELRVAKNDDLDSLMRMGKELYIIEKQFEPMLKFSSSKARHKYLQELMNQNALILIVEEKHKAIGYLYAHAEEVEYLDTSKLECEIEVIYIDDEYRGKGLAQQLIDKALYWAKTKNIFRIKAGIYAQNESSQAAFLKCGFSPFHTTYILSNSK